MKNENVLCVELALLQKTFPLERRFWQTEAAVLDGLDYGFAPRSEAEWDFTRKQLIPYALLFAETGRVLTYRRHGSEGRLAGRYSAGIGGHVNDRDAGATLSDRLLSGLTREMREETGVTPSPGQIEFLGMINEDESEVGRCHVGVVFRVILEPSQVLSFSGEIAEPAWRSAAELDLSRFELWSALALRLAAEQKEV
ncbi:MAG: NUDIX domain-containing protein [Deltaproteobacteria bacterium]|nr:NUDIX domain-containing protein [Deltaproteobacteria bacterium]